MKLFNSKKQGAKKTSKAQPKKKFILSRKQKIIVSVVGVLVLATAGFGAYAYFSSDEVGAGGCRAHIYKTGSSSICVKYAAKMLNATPSTGADIKDVDTSFGSQTHAKVVRFQKKYGLSQDGKIGPNTWTKLCIKSNASDSTKRSAGCKYHARTSQVPAYWY